MSRTGEVSFSLSFKHLEIGRGWFQWDSTKCTNNRKVAYERNFLTEDNLVARESVHVGLINDIDGMSCNNIRLPIPEEVTNEIKTESKE